MIDRTDSTIIEDILREHALGLLIARLSWAQNQGWLRFEQGDGALIWPEEVQRLLAQLSRTMAGPQLELPTEQPLADCGARLRARLKSALTASTDHTAERWHDLIHRLRLDLSEVQALALMVSLHLDQSLARAWRYAWASASQLAPTWGFMVQLLSDRGESGAAERSLAPSRSALFTWRLLELHATRPETPLSEQTLCLALEVMPVLMGWGPEPDELRGFDQIDAPPPRLAESLRPRLRALLGTAKPLRAAVHGPQGSGRLAVAAQIAQGAGVREGLWSLNLGRAVDQGRALQDIARAHRMSALLDVAVVVDGLDRLGEHEQRWVEAVEDAFARASTPLIWVLSAAPASYFQIDPSAVVIISYPPKPVRLDMWRETLSGAGLGDGLISQLASQYLLSEGQIAQISCRARARQEDRPLFDVLADEAREASKLGLGRLATPETARVQLDQLIVNEETETALVEVIGYARNRHRLMTEWGFGDRLSYGLGVTCLFAGPPGTGKTFGAQAIATALSLELYRVDLSQLVSKYIGETEKHLGELFDAAEQGEVLLLFDEADSLFGKRTEVKTSVDRYANLEVNFLLQRIERFNGITILTTNFEAGIDDAFARRIRFKVSFDAPDEQARRRIWQAMLPDPARLADDVDLQVLAHHYELSGGHIKEVVLRAASLAMSLNHHRLDFKTLIRSANVEYRKLGKLPISLSMSSLRRR